MPPTPTVVVRDLKTKKAVSLPVSEAAARIKGGLAEQMEKVTIIDRIGEPQSVDVVEADLSLRGQTATLPSPEAEAQIRREGQVASRFSSAGAQAQAGLEGLLRSVTLGGSDAVALAAGAEEGVRLRRAHAGAAALAGELAGAFVPGSGLLGRASKFLPAGAAVKGAARLAARTEAAIGTRALLGAARAGKTAEAAKIGLLARAAPAAAQGAAEAAAFGAGQGLSSAMLSDKPLTAEMLLSSVGTGALLGGVTGGAAGGALGLGSGLLRRLAKAPEGPAAAKVVSNIDEISKAGKRGENTAALRQAQRAVIEDLDSSFDNAIALIDEEVASAERALKVKPRELGALPIDARSTVGRRVDALKQARKKALAQRARFDKAATGRGGRLTDDYFDDLAGKGDKEAGRVLDTANRYQGVTRELHELIKPGSSAATVTEPIAALSKTGIGQIDSLDAVAIASETGLIDPRDVPVIGGVADLFLKARLFGRMGAMGVAAASKVAAPAAVSAVQNSAVNAGRQAVRSVLGGGVAGRAGAGLLDVAIGQSAGLAASAGKVVGRLRKAVDDFVSSPLSGKAGKLAASTLPQAPITVLGNITFGDRSAGKVTPRKGESKTMRVYRQRELELRDTVANLPAFRQRASDRLAAVKAANAALHAEIVDGAVRRALFLHSKLPSSPAVGGPVGGYDKFQPSLSSVAKFARYAAATENPESILESMKRGTLTPEEAETMRVVYPQMFAKVQEFILDNVATLQEDLPYQKRVQLSILFRVPADTTMSPAFVQRMQAQFVTEQENQKPNTSAVGSISQKFTDALVTQTQQL